MELRFSQNFSLVALNAQDSLHLTNAKKVALRCMAAASILELYLEQGFTLDKDMVTFNRKGLERPDIPLYQEIVLEAVLGRKESSSDTLAHLLTVVSKLSKKYLLKIERAFADSLIGNHALEEIPNLLGCDLLFNTAGVSMKEYRSNEELFTRVIENLRAETLEEGLMTDESIFMLWLMRESGCLNDIFSDEELKRVRVRMSELFENSNLARKVLPVAIHSSREITIKKFLRLKRAAMSTPTGIGINFTFPAFERSQSVFIDTEAYFGSKEERLCDVLTRLREKGHNYTVLSEGTVPLIKIDNLIYEAVPSAVNGGKMPIHGVRLRRYPLY